MASLDSYTSGLDVRSVDTRPDYRRIEADLGLRTRFGIGALGGRGSWGPFWVGNHTRSEQAGGRFGDGDEPGRPKAARRLADRVEKSGDTNVLSKLWR